MGVTAATIESALGELQDLPTPVSSWRVETGEDWANDPAVWVWAMLAEEGVDYEKRSLLRKMVRDLVRRQIEVQGWVYVRFRSAAEEGQLGCTQTCCDRLGS